MHLVTHGLLGWAIGALTRLDRRGARLVALAGLLPDLDGIGLPLDLLNRLRGVQTDHWGEWHHELGHNLGVALLAAAGGAILAGGRRAHRGWVGLLCLLSVHLHILGDLVGGRGPDGDRWPIPYLRPFWDQPRLSWSGQWALNAWPNIVLTVVLLGLGLRHAWRGGCSPVGLISARADSTLSRTLRARFGQPGSP